MQDPHELMHSLAHHEPARIEAFVSTGLRAPSR
jgi:hypothetical protein